MRPRRKALRILLVDASEAVEDRLSSRLPHGPRARLCAAEGVDAFDVADELQPDLILLAADAGSLTKWMRLAAPSAQVMELEPLLGGRAVDGKTSEIREWLKSAGPLLETPRTATG